MCDEGSGLHHTALGNRHTNTYKHTMISPPESSVDAGQ